MPEQSRGNTVGDSDTAVGNEPPSHHVQSELEQLCALQYSRVAAFIEEDVSSKLLEDVQQQTRIALEVSKQALTRYSFEELCLSYNGGKDCLVLLVIYLAAIHTHFRSGNTTPSDTSTASAQTQTPQQIAAPIRAFPRTINTVYIQSAHPFAEVDSFVHTSSHDYRLSLTSSTLPMKAAFAQYLEQNTNVKAIFVGTRRTDPHGANLTHFDPTDSGWPPFMRIHPVIDWHYQEIWAFIKHLDIPYCSLYDLGYTSLGGTTDTHPNPKLRVEGSDGRVAQARYRPAYELVEDDEERLGRDWHKK